MNGVDWSILVGPVDRSVSKAHPNVSPTNGYRFRTSKRTAVPHVFCLADSSAGSQTHDVVVVKSRKNFVLPTSHTHTQKKLVEVSNCVLLGIILVPTTHTKQTTGKVSK